MKREINLISILVLFILPNGMSQAENNLQDANASPSAESYASNSQEKSTNGSVGILACDIKIPSFDSTTREQVGNIELRAGDTVNLIEIQPDAVIISKDGSVKVKEPLTVLTPDSLTKAKEEINKTTSDTTSEEKEEYLFSPNEKEIAEIKKLIQKQKDESTPTWSTSTTTREECKQKLQGYKKEMLEKLTKWTRKAKDDTVLTWNYSFFDVMPIKNSSLIDDYKNLNIPILKQNTEEDNSTVIAVANALNYIYSKKEKRPVNVSMPFLLWAHDMYPYTDEEIKTIAWNNEAIKYNQEEDIAGEDHVSSFDGKQEKNIININAGLAKDKSSSQSAVHPITIGKTRRVDLETLLKAVQRFGVCEVGYMPYIGRYQPPSTAALEDAQKRKNEGKIAVKCFNSLKNSIWKDENIVSEETDILQNYANQHGGHLNKGVIYYNNTFPLTTQYYTFINENLSKDIPVIKTKMIVSKNKQSKDAEYWEKESSVLVKFGRYLGRYNKPQVTLESLEKDGSIQTKQEYSEKYDQFVGGSEPYRGEKKFELYSIGLEPPK